ncbi:hypothetical protein B296_00041904 [Ensete ventricosum]|uniref:Uncharacterized protein n=1 Tax=Ensete ventricosum TaxID=4639 RepID=A0A426X538_ENSVE|nr:hypothetical protein B296_00041904 [Ensete ventricosum]
MRCRKMGQGTKWMHYLKQLSAANVPAALIEKGQNRVIDASLTLIRERAKLKLQSDDGPRSSLGIGPGSDDAVGSCRSSLGDLPKGSGSSLGTRREIVGRRPEDSPQECRRLLDWRELGLDYLDWSLSVIIIES